MNESSPVQKGLVRPHTHYSCLKTASEGLPMHQEAFPQRMHHSPESDSESLAQEIEYQLELQKWIQDNEEVASPSDSEQEEVSLEVDSLEESLSGGEDSEVEEAQIPHGSSSKNENGRHASNKEELVDRYSELRYDPNWKNHKKGIELTELKESHQENGRSSPVLSPSLTRSPSQFRVADSRRQLHGQPQNIPSISDGDSSHFHERRSSDGSDRPYRNGDKDGELAAVCHYSSCSNIYSSRVSQSKAFNQQRSRKDFVEKNKVTLGMATPLANSYLQVHGKRQSRQRKACSYQGSEMSSTNSSQSISLGKDSLDGSSHQHLPLGAPAELRRHHGRHHNVSEFENAHTSSHSSGEVPDLEQDTRRSLHHRLYANPLSVAPPQPSVVKSSTAGQGTHRDPAYAAHQNGQRMPVSLTLARNPLQLSSYQNVPRFHLPWTSGMNKRYQHDLEHDSERHQYRCTVSEPQTASRRSKGQGFLGQKHISYSYSADLQQPLNAEASPSDPSKMYTEKILRNYVSGNSRSSQSSVHNLRRTPSPTTWLIQQAEHRHQEISRLADEHLAGSELPAIMQRGESDSQLDMESGGSSQPVLSRSNSEGYLLQMEKQKERKEKEDRKGSRTKGYMKTDVKLGGLGPDYETIKEKSGKIKKQKEYAEQVKEQNMKSIRSVRKQPLRPEKKSSLSRQKALEYAKRIPKPKLFTSRPPEQEPKDEKTLARTLNGENLPPISSLESLQNRHEHEKQVVAAFKTLHIV